MYKRICATCGGDVTFDFNKVVSADPSLYKGCCDQCGAISYITYDEVMKQQKLQDMTNKQYDDLALEKLQAKTRPKVIYKSPQIKIDKKAVAIGLAGALLISLLIRRK